MTNDHKSNLGNWATEPCTYPVGTCAYHNELQKRQDELAAEYLSHYRDMLVDTGHAEKKPCQQCIDNCMACRYDESESGPVYDDHLCLDCNSGGPFDPHLIPSSKIQE